MDKNEQMAKSILKSCWWNGKYKSSDTLYDTSQIIIER